MVSLRWAKSASHATLEIIQHELELSLVLLLSRTDIVDGDTPARCSALSGHHRTP